MPGTVSRNNRFVWFLPVAHLLADTKSMSTQNSPAEQAAVCAVYLKAIGDPIRLQIVKALQCGPMTVSDIAELLELQLPNASHHLRVLFHANLAVIEKDGKFSYYRLNEEFLKRRSVSKSLDFGCCKIDLRD